MIFKKKDPISKLFTHVFSLNALNCIFQIVMPYFDPDKPLYDSGSIETIWCPPIFGNKHFNEIGSLTSLSFDLNGAEKVINERESIGIPVSPEEFEISKIVDKVIGEVKDREFDGNRIIGIDLKMTLVNNDNILKQ